MKIIAIEGIDASGKETQTQMLYDKLSSLGYVVGVESFPRYNTPIGIVIKHGLRSNVPMNDMTLHMLLEADRQNYMDEIRKYEDSGVDFLVLDRFTLSNTAFCLAKGIDLDWVKALQSKIRQPDLTLVLDVTAETSMKRKAKGYGEREMDKHEKDKGLLNRARAAYTYLADELSKVEGDDKLIYLVDANRTPEEVHEEVMEYVRLAYLRGEKYEE